MNFRLSNIILCCLIVLKMDLGAQSPNFGIPFIQSFSKEIYQAGPQNWDIVQDNSGVMYFANSEGMLYYDGTKWMSYGLPNKTIIRSVALDANGVIYAGGQNEFGRFIPNHQGALIFESLRHLIPEEHQNFEDVWEIISQGTMVYFRSSGKVFRLSGEKCYVYPGVNFGFMGKANDEIMLQDLKEGLFYVRGDSLIKITGSGVFVDKQISAIESKDQSTLVATINQGFYTISSLGIQHWKTDVDEFLMQNHITVFKKISEGRLVVGTDFGGLLLIDAFGETIYHLDQENGLLNNKVLSIAYDQSKNLWLGLNNGINYIQINSPFTHVYPDNLDGEGYAVRVFQDNIYFATSNGLYVTPWSDHPDPLKAKYFELVTNTKGQTWGLDQVGENLILGHNNGAFLIEDKTAKPFYNENGVWTFDLLDGQAGYAISGTYEGLNLWETSAEGWEFVNQIPNFNESSRFVETDNQGNIWVAHPYRGVYKIGLKNGLDRLELTAFSRIDSVSNNLHNHLFKIKSEIIFCPERGAYLFNESTQTFQPYTAFNNIFGPETKIRRLFETPNGDIWFITNSEIGILKVDDRGLDKKIQKQIFPDIKPMLNTGFESIYAYDNDNVFISTQKGFIHYNAGQLLFEDTLFQVLVNEVKLTSISDSTLFSGFYFNENTFSKEQPENQIPVLAKELNALQFSFSTPQFSNAKQNSYRFYLKGFEKDWSDWTDKQIKEYTNLSAGNYAFHLQAKNFTGALSQTFIYEFEIKPAWYESTLAYLIYTLMTFLLLGFIISKNRKKYEGLKEDHKETVKQSIEEINKLKAEKMSADLNHKQRELVSATMHLVKKNETLELIRENLIEIKKKNKNEGLNQDLHKLIKRLEQDEFMDSGWDQFMLHFKQIHGDFFNRLNEKYPDLTPKDLKMCAYLRMNLTTKEMATLMNVTSRGVEASRYRLRKKMQLTKEDNLTSVLMSF